ncbi:MAG: ABC transporter substrate-binding protein [Firmicutes bacterium]|nr:ABC transporter substrate-binding protein [Bacillota bacterium]
MKPKKLLFGVLVLCVLSFGIQSVNAAPIKIDLWHAMGGIPGPTLEKIAEEFNASQNDVELHVHYQGSYYDLQQKFMASIAAKNPPALVQLPIEGTGVFGPTGALADLSGYLEDDPEIGFEHFQPGLLVDSWYKDQFLAIPFNRSNPVLYYNVDHFIEAGLGTEAPETWEELIEYSEKLTIVDDDGRIIRHGFSPNLHWWTLTPMIWSNGGNLADPETGTPMFASAEVAEVLNLISDMVNVSRTARVYAGTVFSAGDRARADFNQGKISMYIQSIGSLAGFDEELNLKTAFVPRFKDSEFVVPNGGGSLFMAENLTKEQKDAAWEVIKYFVQADTQAFWSQSTGYMPTCLPALDTPEMTDFYSEKPNYKTAVNQLPYAQKIPSSEVFLDIINVFESAVQEIVISQVDAFEVLEEAIKLIN